MPGGRWRETCVAGGNSLSGENRGKKIRRAIDARDRPDLGAVCCFTTTIVGAGDLGAGRWADRGNCYHRHAQGRSLRRRLAGADRCHFGRGVPAELIVRHPEPAAHDGAVVRCKHAADQRCGDHRTAAEHSRPVTGPDPGAGQR